MKLDRNLLVISVDQAGWHGQIRVLADCGYKLQSDTPTRPAGFTLIPIVDEQISIMDSDPSMLTLSQSIFKAYDIHAASSIPPSTLDADIARKISGAHSAAPYVPRASRLCRDGPRWALVRPGALAAALAEELQCCRRRRCRRPRRGGDTDGLFRNPCAGCTIRHHGYGQPQSAGLQWIQDGIVRRSDLRRYDPEPLYQAIVNKILLKHGAGSYRTHDIAEHAINSASLATSNWRGRLRDCNRLREWRGRCICRRFVPSPGL